MSSGSWDSMTTEERQARVEAIRSGTRRYWDSLTSAGKQERRIRWRKSFDSSGVRNIFQSPEFAKQHKSSMEQYWLNLSPEERVNKSRLHSLATKRHLDSLTEEQKQIRAIRSSRGVRAYYSQLDSASRESSNQKRSTRMKEIWAELSSTDKEKWLRAWIHNEKVYEGKREFWASLPEEEKARRTQVRMNANRVNGPTELELWVNILLELLYPGLWDYNGLGDVNIVVGGKVPDFVRRDGVKQVIDVFGDYWHDTKEERRRRIHFESYGFDCIILWENDCLSRDTILAEVGGRILT